MTMNGKLDKRFSETDQAAEWSTVSEVLAGAELYWLTTVRGDGRPHVTPLVGVWANSPDKPALVFCTGSDEQKACNLDRNANVAVTTGANTWKDGLDIVVEGLIARVNGEETLKQIADSYREKYDGEWDFDNDDEVFDPAGTRAHVFRVTPTKVIAFAKSPHGQTTFKP
jgi:general stress protein 26